MKWNRSKRYIYATLLLAMVAGLFFIGTQRLSVNNDITAALPQSDPVVAAGRRILLSHPALDNVFIDLSLADGSVDREELAGSGDLVAVQLEKSGLVRIAAGKAGGAVAAAAYGAVTDHLPLFFSHTQLVTEVMPLLQPVKIEKALRDEQRKLFELGSIGQMQELSRDPLGLRNLIFARFAALNPFPQASLYRGHVFSIEGRHLLIMAEPVSSARDTVFGRRLKAVLDDIDKKLNSGYQGRVKMVYTGAFRAALDNEDIIKRDMGLTLSLLSVGLMLLAFFCFRRPLIGLLASVPGFAGVMLAVFGYSLFKPSIFAISLGFGGALVSIAVDHGLAYVILLDRPFETRGHDVSREVWSVASFTVHTTVVALLTLLLMGIPLFTEVGLFAALGAGFSAAFAHLFFPTLFPTLPGAKKTQPLFIDRLMERLSRPLHWMVVAMAGLFFLFMLALARFDFAVNIESMNTVHPETLAAENVISKTWGALSRRIFMQAEAKDPEGLWVEAERLAEIMKKETAGGALLTPAPRMLTFPSPRAQRENLKDWLEFWTQERREALRAALQASAVKLGFNHDAFDEFIALTANPPPGPLKIPAELYSALGIFRERQGNGWFIFEATSPGPAYNAEQFFSRFRDAGFAVFDPGYFFGHLSRILSESFVSMLVILGMAAFLLLLVLYLDWQLLFVSFIPLLFSLVSTVGTMRLIGEPLGIPSLMLAPILVGLGMDYGICLVRARQLFGDESHPSITSFRAAIMLGGVVSLIGMGAMIFSRHAVLRSAGISTFLGIAYAMVGAFVFVPFFLKYIFKPIKITPSGLKPASRDHFRLALQRFRHLEPGPRLFAKYKMKLDPLFNRLAEFVDPTGTVIDIGCGYGVPAVWLATLYPKLRFVCLEPDRERARVAERVLGENAVIIRGGALDLPPVPAKVETVIMLDMAHYLSDDELITVLGKLHTKLLPAGKLVIRSTVAFGGRLRFYRWVETFKMRLKGLTPHFREVSAMTGLLSRCRYRIDLVEPTAPDREDTWFIAGPV